MCAQFAMFSPNKEKPVSPENKSISINPGIKYFAFIGNGKNSNISPVFGNISPKATRIPYKAPEAPTAGVLNSINNRSMVCRRDRI